MELVAPGYVAYSLMENRFGIKVMHGKRAIIEIKEAELYSTQCLI